jgi:hypothetical protein
MLIIKIFFFCLLFFFGSVLDIICASIATSSNSGMTNSESIQVPKKLSKQGQKIEKQSHKEAKDERFYRDQSPHTRRVANHRTVAREAIIRQGIHKAEIGDAEYRMEEFKNHPKGFRNEQKTRKARAIKGEKKESKKVDNVIRDIDFHVAKGTMTHEDSQSIHQAIGDARRLARLN